MEETQRISRIKINGSLYKVGSHGLVFRLDFNEWIRSSKPREEILAAIAQAEKRIRLNNYIKRT